MELNTAISLIENGVGNSPVQRWADLGCGKGLFTRALASRLPSGSTIDAIDEQRHVLGEEVKMPGIVVTAIQGDFLADDVVAKNLDGILMANSLHFVDDKLSFFEKLKRHLGPSGRLIVVEYDMVRGNPWVPFPVSRKALEKLNTDSGLGTITWLETVESVINSAAIYSAVLHRAVH